MLKVLQKIAVVFAFAGCIDGVAVASSSIKYDVDKFLEKNNKNASFNH